jgi:hypothetical protein
MFAAIITDCKDDNALGRSKVRLSQYVNCPITTVGVNGWDADLEAAGNLIDLLDASEGKPGVIIVNVAPRHKSGKKWPNGTPFSYFHYKETLIVSSIDGLTLSLVKKLGLIDSVNIMDIPTVLKSLEERGVITQELVDHILHTQFRSFEFLPRVAGWLLDGLEIPAEKYSLKEVVDAPKAVWWIDNFGNVKTTLLENDVDFVAGKVIKTSVGELKCFNRLKDVPDHEEALIIGSSGLGEKRFLEIVVQGISAEKHFSITSGQEV